MKNSFAFSQIADRFVNPDNFTGCKKCAYVSEYQQLSSIECDNANGSGVLNYVCQKKGLLKFFRLK